MATSHLPSGSTIQAGSVLFLQRTSLDPCPGGVVLPQHLQTSCRYLSPVLEEATRGSHNTRGILKVSRFPTFWSAARHRSRVQNQRKFLEKFTNKTGGLRGEKGGDEKSNANSMWKPQADIFTFDGMGAQ